MSFTVKQLEAAKQPGWQVELFGSLHAHRVGIRSVQGPHMRIEPGLRACLKSPLINHSAAKDRFRTDREVDAALADAGAVLITGPANARTELMKHIEAHAPELAQIIAGIETVDHPTDKDLIAHARRYFKASDRMRPQRQ